MPFFSKSACRVTGLEGPTGEKYKNLFEARLVLGCCMQFLKIFWWSENLFCEAVGNAIIQEEKEKAKAADFQLKVSKMSEVY